MEHINVLKDFFCFFKKKTRAEFMRKESYLERFMKIFKSSHDGINVKLSLFIYILNANI